MHILCVKRSCGVDRAIERCRGSLLLLSRALKRQTRLCQAIYSFLFGVYLRENMGLLIVMELFLLYSMGIFCRNVPTRFTVQENWAFVCYGVTCLAGRCRDQSFVALRPRRVVSKTCGSSPYFLRVEAHVTRQGKSVSCVWGLRKLLWPLVLFDIDEFLNY